MLDLLYPLLHLVEDDSSALDQNAPMFGQRDSACRPVEQWGAQHVFHVRDGFRDGWLRQGEMLRCLSHASGLGHHLQGMQILEPQPPSDAIVPVHSDHLPL